MSSVSRLTGQWAKKNNLSFWQKEEIDSTNNIAKEEAFQVDAFKLYIADKQTEGRGRHKNQKTNTWIADTPGKYLLSTWAFTLEEPLQPITSPQIGLALFKAVEQTWPLLQWSLSAPNDLYLGDKKIGGLLIENITQGEKHFVAVGLGLNVLDSPKEILTSTHLSSADGTGAFFNQEKWFLFLDNLYRELMIALQKGIQPTINKEDRESLLTALNTNPTKEETFLDIGENGDLVTEEKTLVWSDL